MANQKYRASERVIGKDRITARQIFKGLDFIQRSDFRGLQKEAGEKASAVFGFIAGMIMNSVKKMDIKPLKVGKHKTTDVINQDVNTARENLKAQGITDVEVKLFKPGLNAESAADIASFPVRLKSGQKVNLYEENGRVRYYSIVKEKKPADINASDVIRLDSEVKNIRSNLNELNTVKAEVATVKISSETSRNEITKEVGIMKAQLSAVDEIKKELETTRQQSAQKDEQIDALKKEVETLRAAQSEIMKRITPETIARIEQEIKELKESRVKIEKSTKKIRKSPSG